MAMSSATSKAPRNDGGATSEMYVGAVDERIPIPIPPILAKRTEGIVSTTREVHKGVSVGED